MRVGGIGTRYAAWIAALALASGVSRFEPLTAADRQGLRGWATVLRPPR